MKHTLYIIISIVLSAAFVSPCTAQSKENERLKEALEQAFAPNAAPTSTEQTNQNSTKTQPSPVQNPSTGQVLYYVQLFYSRTPADVEQKKASSLLGKITRYTHNGLYKYCAGGFPSKADADAMVQKAKNAGYTSAFVIALQDGQRIK